MLKQKTAKKRAHQLPTRHYAYKDADCSVTCWPQPQSCCDERDRLYQMLFAAFQHAQPLINDLLARVDSLEGAYGQVRY